MAQAVGDPLQVINFNYKEDLSSYLLNKLFNNVFTEGILDVDIEFGNNFIKINRISFFIRPYNYPEIIVKVDTTESFILPIVNINQNKLVARYEWKEIEENYVDFLYVSELQQYDVLIGELEFDGSGNLVNINYDNQNISNVNMFYEGISLQDASTIDCYAPGNETNNLALNNGSLNIGLVAEKISNYLLSNFAINDGTLQVGLNAEKLNGYIADMLGIKDGVLREVNADKLDGKDADEIAQCSNADQNNCSHIVTHNYDDIIDGSYYKKIKNLTSDRKVQASTIKNNSLGSAIYDIVERREYPTVSNQGQLYTPTLSASYNPSEIKILANKTTVTSWQDSTINISSGNFTEFAYVFTGVSFSGKFGTAMVNNVTLTSFSVYPSSYGAVTQDSSKCNDLNCTDSDLVYLVNKSIVVSGSIYYFVMGR